VRAAAFAAPRAAGLRAADFAARDGASNKSGCFGGFFLVEDLAMQSRRWG
jgi:hypothetical protein